LKNRPDLLAGVTLDSEQKQWLAELEKETVR